MEKNCEKKLNAKIICWCQDCCHFFFFSPFTLSVQFREMRLNGYAYSLIMDGKGRGRNECCFVLELSGFTEWMAVNGKILNSCYVFFHSSFIVNGKLGTSWMWMEEIVRLNKLVLI